MGQMKNYLISLICVGSDAQEQEAIEYAIYQGWFKPTYNFPQDKIAIQSQLLTFVEKFKQEANEAVANEPMQQFIDSIAALNVKEGVGV